MEGWETTWTVRIRVRVRVRVTVMWVTIWYLTMNYTDGSSNSGVSLDEGIVLRRNCF